MITITYNRDKKTAAVNGALGLASVETVTVVSDASAALAEGTVCLHVPGTDTALAEWAVAAGACETDTRAPALTGWFAARPALECADFTVRVKDADGNPIELPGQAAAVAADVASPAPSPAPQVSAAASAAAAVDVEMDAASAAPVRVAPKLNITV